MAVLEADLKPSVDEVALLLRTKTVGGAATGGLGSDTGPADLTTFDATTRPKATEVARVVTTAYGAVFSRINGSLATIPADQGPSLKFAVTAYAVMLVLASFFEGTVTDAQLAFWRDLSTEAIIGVNDGILGNETGRVYRMGTLTIGGIRTTVVPNHDPVQGIDF